MLITEYAVEDGIPVVYIFGRNKDGKRTLVKDSKFRPYFYCRKKDIRNFDNADKVIKIEDVPQTDIKGNQVCKITCKIPADVPILRALVSESYEADVLYPIRYSIDNYDEIEGTPLSVMYIDIETASGRAFPNVQAAQDEITLITVFNNMNKKCVTFVWRADQQERTEHNGKNSFVNVDGSIYEYDDYTMFFNDERSMLIKFLKCMIDLDPDMFTGWNVYDFDMRYLINRMNNLGVNCQKLSPMNFVMTNEWKDVIIKGRIVFDMLDAIRKMSAGELDSYKLDEIALQELGENKVPMPKNDKGKKLTHKEFWQTDLPLYIEYNKKDTMLVYRIEKKKKIIQSFDEVRRMSKCAFNDVFHNSRVVDAFSLSYCKGTYVLPTKGGHKKESYGGGKVISPKKGIHEWVHVFDFKALYPKIISSLNASPETVVSEKTKDTVNVHIPYIDTNMFFKDGTKKKKFDDPAYKRAGADFDKFFESNWDLVKQEFSGVIPTHLKRYIKYKDVYFDQSKKGFIPSILEHLFDERIKIQKERDTHKYGSPEYIRLEFKQYAFKILMNSFYGVLGHNGFRLYTPEIAASITFVGRNAILWSRKIAQQNGYEVLYGDTDSIFVVSNENELKKLLDEGVEVNQLLQDSYKLFSSFFDMNKHYLLLEYEKVFRRIFFGQAKKRYAGMLAWYKGKETSDLKITGFEVVRTNQSHLARETQKKVFDMLIKQNLSKEKITEYVRKVSKSIKEGKASPEDIGIPTPLRKPLSEYKSKTPAVRAVMFSNRNLKLAIRPGEKFFILYVKDVKGMPKTDAIAIRDEDDIPGDVIYDYQKHSDEATKDKMRAIFDGLGWSLGELTGQKSLMDF